MIWIGGCWTVHGAILHQKFRVRAQQTGRIKPEGVAIGTGWMVPEYSTHQVVVISLRFQARLIEKPNLKERFEAVDSG